MPISVNMEKARAIHLAAIRRVRDAELKVEDVNMARAIDSGDTIAQSEVTARKQALRDIPATFDLTEGIDTPEALKARWPDQLPIRS